MKKVLLAMLLILPIVFQSCSDDDDSLIGTEWTCLTTDNDWTVLQFPDDKQFILTYYEGNNRHETTSDPVQGTYTISGSTVSLFYEEEVITGTLNGNKLTFIEVEYGIEFRLVFTKK